MLYKLVKKLFFVSLVFHLISAWFNVGYYHADEYFQVTEFASFKLGQTPAADLAWEYNAALRPAVQPFMLYTLFKTFHLSNPVYISFAMRFISALASWLVSCFFILTMLSQVHSEKIKKVILYLSMFLWFLPFIHGRFSSENWSAIFFFAGLSFLIRLISNDAEKPDGKNTGLLLFCGVLLGLSYVFRFQSAIMIAGLFGWLVIYKKIGLKNFAILVSGILLSVIVGIMIDRWFYGRWVFTALNYFRINILEGKTADFGVMPWWDYFRMIFVNLIPPFSIAQIILIVIFFIRYPKHILTWICLPFILVHVLNGHKEMRFLFPLVTALPVVIGLSLDGEAHRQWLRKLITWFHGKTSAILFRIFIVMNVLLMIAVAVRPANENFPVYDFIWSHYHDKEIQLYSFSGDPYMLVGLHVDFYKPEKMTVTDVKSDFDFSAQSSDDNRAILLLFKGRYSDQPPFQNEKNVTLVYQNIPDWLQHFNFNNWLSRSQTWRLYKIKNGLRPI